MLDIKSLREKYPKSTRLMLLSDLDDTYSPHFEGDILIVSYIDDIGQIHGSWKSGGSLALIVGVDNFKKVE